MTPESYEKNQFLRPFKDVPLGPNEFDCENGRYRVENGRLIRLTTNPFGAKGVVLRTDATRFLIVASLLDVVEGRVKVGDVCPRCYENFEGMNQHDRRGHVYFCTGKGWTTGYSEQGMEFFVICGQRYDAKEESK